MYYTNRHFFFFFLESLKEWSTETLQQILIELKKGKTLKAWMEQIGEG